MTRTDLTSVSIYISLLLRHKPEAAGLVLDEHGWVQVDDLICGVNKTRILTMEMLEEIVRTDDKQRCSFSPDKSKIRANQGHSIPVDVELQEKEPPEYLWHGTAEKYLESIRRDGLVPKARLYVHLSDQKTAYNVGSSHGAPYVLRIKNKAMAQDGYLFYLSENGVWLTQKVPVKYIEWE